MSAEHPPPETSPFIRVLGRLNATAVIALVWFGIAHAHSADHLEHDDWLMAQTNQNNGVCCDGEDVIALSDSAWRTEGGHYEVALHGRWTLIEPWMLTQSLRIA
jgi:hypothetical protein